MNLLLIKKESRIRASVESMNITSENTLRRKARRRGYKLSKIRETSRWYHTYGPFIISEAVTNVVIH